MKKSVFVPLLIAVPIAVGLSTYFVTHTIERKIADSEKKSLGELAMSLHYNGRVALFKEENKHLSNVDVSFIGDSLTEGYDVKTFYPDYNVVNRGISGDTTFGVEKRLDCSAYDVKPKVISMLIGANNFSSMMENYESIVQKFHQNLPETKVILCSLTSMTGDWGKNNEIARQNNVEIQKIATKYGYVYADLYNPLLDPDTNELREEYSVDGGHLTSEGYKVVTSVITPILQTLI